MPKTDIFRCGAELSMAKTLCVFVHGRGQTPEEINDGVIARVDAPDTAFWLPRQAQKAWYTAKAVDPLTNETQTEIDRSLEFISAVMREARSAAAGRPVLLAGFSQGACLSLEYGFAGGSDMDALAAFTGCRVGKADDNRPASFIENLPAYLSGSDADPWIPVTAFAETALELGQARVALRCDLFPGRDHQVSDAECRMLATLLHELTGQESLIMGAPR